MEQTNILNNVMKKVYIVHFFRSTLPKLIGEAILLGILMTQERAYISIRFVLRNAVESINNIPSFIHFSWSALVHTEIQGAIILTLGIIVGIVGIQELKKLIKDFAFLLRLTKQATKNPFF